MSRETRQLFGPRSPAHMRLQSRKWAIRRDIPVAILAWTALAAVIIWAAGHIGRSLLVLAIASLLAFAFAPAVKLLQRFMPRFLAILVVYLVVLSAVSVFCYLIINTAIQQTVALSAMIKSLLGPGRGGQPTSIDQLLISFGISQDQIALARQQIVTQAEELAKNSFPLLRSAFGFVIDTIVVAVLSIYLLIDGSRAASWIRNNAPQAVRMNFLLNVLQRVVGGYIRGQLTLALLIGFLVGAGMGLIFHLPYAVFLGVLAFVMAFIPVLGTLISGAVCVLVGLTHGWLVAVGVLIYFVVIHVIESEVVGPRIVGKAIGLHPVISLFALIAGAEIFGIWGALFASPIAGVLQSVIIVLWREWRDRHPELFQAAKTGLPLAEEAIVSNTNDRVDIPPPRL